MKIVILIPVFNDFKSASKLIEEIDINISELKAAFSVIVMNDASTEEKILETKEDIIILLLDHITDPNNLGSILRTSLGGLVDAVVVPKSRACHLTKSVREVSKGSSELIPFVIVPNLKRITEMLKLRGFLIYGAEGGNQSKSIYDTDFSKKVGLIIGSENTGIQETLKSKCDKMIKIPISNKLESLNAAIATSVIVFEINRQRIN